MKRTNTVSVSALVLVCVGVMASCSRPPTSASTDDSTSALLASGQVTLNVPLPPNVPMSEVALASSSTILLGSNVNVTEEGSANAKMTIANTGRGTTSTQTGVVLHSDLWSVGDVFLASSTSVTGSVTTGGALTQQTGVTIGGTALQHQALTSTPTTLIVTFPSSSTNVTLQPGQTSSIAPGAFASVTVNSRATLTLSSGTYFIDSLDIEPQGVVALSGAGPFVLNVRSSFLAKGQITLPASSPQPTLIVVDAGSPDVFLQAEFDGTLIAPNANVTLAAIGSASYHGAFFGKSMTLQAGVTMLHRATSAGSVVPIAECKITNSDGTFKAVFGYSASSLAGNITIPIGSDNTFTTGAASRGQPQTFIAGRHKAQFAFTFDGNPVTWLLDGVPTSASVLLPECTPACVQQLVDPSKPRIDTVLTTAAPSLSTDESAAMRDSFRWQDTVPVPETFSDGTPRIYYSLVFVNSKDTLRGLDALRIHYANKPLFEQEMQGYEAQGIHGKFWHPWDSKGQFVYAFIPGATYNTIRQAALDPSSPEEILKAMVIRPIPASDLGFPAQTSCGLQPVAQCVAQASNGSLRAVFSYNNPSGGSVTIPNGPDNNLTGGPSGSIPPEAFAAGQHTAVFAVPLAAGGTVKWQLNGTTISENAQTARCSAAIVAQIGVDQFKPFPAPETPSCRFATPAETQFPASQLPPAARANTCASLSYQFVGTVGFKWRGVDNDADDVSGLAADALLALGSVGTSAPVASVTSSASTGNTSVVRSALLGFLRKAAEFVVGEAKGAVDDFRQGAKGFAGAFVGTTDISFQILPQYTDASITPGTQLQAWGKNFGLPVSLQGIEVRAEQSIFLSRDNLNQSDEAKVTVLNHPSSARLCLIMENGAGKIVDGFLPEEVCPGITLSASNSSPNPFKIADPSLNVMAQMTDTQLYMSKAQGVQTQEAEVAVGLGADLIGKIQGLKSSGNGNRAFTPCLGTFWLNSAESLMVAIGLVEAGQVKQLASSYVRAAAENLLHAMGTAVQQVASASNGLATAIPQLVGAGQQALGQAAQSALAVAAADIAAANNASALLASAADDYNQALATAARKLSGNDPTVAAATAVAQQALDALNAATAAATSAIAVASVAVASASAAVASLSAAVAAGTTVAATLAPVVSGLIGLTGAFTNGADLLVNITGKLVSIGAAAVGVAATLAATAGELFELLAGGDIVLPSGGGARNFTDYGVATHEYGHYVLCNLLDAKSASGLVVAYDEAAAGAFLGQDPSATGAVLNEAFADLIASQVVGGTDYAVPPNLAVPTAMQPMPPPTVFQNQDQSMTFCPATIPVEMPPLAPNTANCIEFNRTNVAMDSFNGEVLRDVTLFNDAFDTPFVTNVIDGHTNGNEWATGPGGLLTLSGLGQATTDEVVNIPRPNNLPSAFAAWIFSALDRGTLLREDNVFGGLSDAMIDSRYGWCERCHVFWLHKVDAAGNNFCPAEWVGPRPSFSVDGGVTVQPLTCVFDDPNNNCPAGLTLNPATDTCNPPCPIAGQHFDSFTLSCVATIPNPG